MLRDSEQWQKWTARWMIDKPMAFVEAVNEVFVQWTEEAIIGWIFMFVFMVFQTIFDEKYGQVVAEKSRRKE